MSSDALSGAVPWPSQGGPGGFASDSGSPYGRSKQAQGAVRVGPLGRNASGAMRSTSEAVIAEGWMNPIGGIPRPLQGQGTYPV